MKKSLLFGIVFLVIALIASPALAQTSKESQTSENTVKAVTISSEEIRLVIERLAGKGVDVNVEEITPVIERLAGKGVDVNVEEIELAIEKIKRASISGEGNKDYALTTYTFTADRVRES